MKKILISKKLIAFSQEIKSAFKNPSVMLSLALKNKNHINVYAITYYSGGLVIAGYIIEPKKRRGKLPAIIWNRGGSKDFGALTMIDCFGRLGRLATKGYIIFASQYSGGPGSEGVDDWGDKNIKDVLVLRDIIKDWPHADVGNIGMIGGSRGGMMTYRALSLVTWIKAAIISAGSADEITAAKTRKGWRKHQISLYGKSKKEQIKRSALYWPEKIYKKTPLLIMHGTGDWRVQAHDSIRMAEKLYQQKVPFRLCIYEGADHGLMEFRGEANEQMFNWLERFLKNKESLPNLKLHGV